MTSMPIFAIIQKGLIEITPQKGVIDSRPTSSLIVCGDLKVVIDIEHPKEDGKQYRKALSELNVTGTDVDAVIFTHLHPDHFGHKDLFPNALFIFSDQERMGFYFNEDRTLRLRTHALLGLDKDRISTPVYTSSVPDLRQLGDQLYIRQTPGHTSGAIAIFACIASQVHAFVGDTFLTHDYFDRWEPPGSSWNKEKIMEHMAFIKENADIIIPGHGAPFKIR
jgi:N-acyl homoserine lactone hydrolase